VPSVQPAAITKEAASANTPSGKWMYRTEVSKIDDSTNAYLSLQSEQPIEGRFGREGYMTLSVYCRESKTDVIFYFAGQFMSDNAGGGAITYRIDKRPAKTQYFRESNNHEALGLWDGGEAIPFIKSLFGAERLFVRATPFNESAVSSEFVIAGLEDAIKPLRKACGWSDEPRNAATDSSTGPSAASVGATYVIQVGSKRTQEEVLAAFADMQRHYLSLLSGYRPMVQKADLGTRGIWYRMRIGPISDQDTAKRLCAQLMSRGLRDCLVTMP
jgi:type VI secretion system protein VasI